jgi:hypothetical protein
MKKAVFLMVAMCFVASLAFAQGGALTTPTAASAPAAEQSVLKGTIIDNMCAGSQKPEKLTEFIKTHTKQCALQCESSGYSIFSDGKLYKFDQDSNAKVAEFLKKEDSKLAVVVTVKKSGEELSLVSIENQK